MEELYHLSKSPLHVAAEEGNVGVVKILLEAGFVDCRTTSGETPLHLAAGSGHDAVVDLLVKAGSDLTSTDTLGFTPLHLAAKKGHTSTVEVLLKAGSDPASKFSEHKTVNSVILDYTPLHLAAREGHTCTVDVLIKAGSDLEAKDKWCKTPLHQAAMKGHLRIVELLLTCGANISTRDKFDCTPLHLAAREGHTSVVEVLLKSGSDLAAVDINCETPLHEAVKHGHLSTVELLLKCGADTSTRDKYNRTPLHIFKASWEGYDSIVEILLENGANPLARDNGGMTPLHSASICHHVSTVEVLLKAGSDPLAMDNRGLTPFDRGGDRIKVLMQSEIEKRKRLEEELGGLGLKTKDGFLDILRQGKYNCFWNRIYLVGPYGTGKSTLAKVLVGEEIPFNREATDGIWIYMGRAGMDLEGKSWKYFPKGNATFEIITSMLMSIDVETPEIPTESNADTCEIQLISAEEINLDINFDSLHDMLVTKDGNYDCIIFNQKQGQMEDTDVNTAGRAEKSSNYSKEPHLTYTNQEDKTTETEPSSNATEKGTSYKQIAINGKGRNVKIKEELNTIIKNDKLMEMVASDSRER